jgi:hypothetical protein
MHRKIPARERGADRPQLTGRRGMRTELVLDALEQAI